MRLDHLLSKEPFKGNTKCPITLEFSFEGCKSFKVNNRFGDDGGGVPRVPISNTTVKPSSADGTWTEGSWESRTSPSRPLILSRMGSQ